MVRSEAIKAAQEKANLCKKPQQVFRYATKEAKWEYDYTSLDIWGRRLTKIPTATSVIIVNPSKIDTDQPK